MKIESFLNEIPKVSLVRHKGMIKIQIYFSRLERKYISTGIAVEAHNWVDGMVVGVRDAIIYQMTMRIVGVMMPYQDELSVLNTHQFHILQCDFSHKLIG